MFADDTNLPPERKDIRQRHNPFLILMNGLFQISSPPLSLNVEKKRNFRIFHKASRRNDLPIVLPKLFINNQVIKRHL